MNTHTGTPEAAQTARRGVPVWVMAVVVTLVLAVGVGVTYAATRPGAQPPGPAPTTPTAEEPTPTPTAPTSEYEVIAGEGGSGLAVDGLTPIGYVEDCAGAASAATNYYVAVQEGLYQDRHTVESFSELLKDINGGLDGWDTARTGPMGALVTEFESIRAEAAASGQEFPGFEEHPEWGVFRVESCAEGASATVAIGSFAETTALAPGYSSPTGGRVRVSWFESDWRLISVEALAAGEHPAVGIVPTDAAAPLPASLRRAILASQPQWTEYANAPDD